MENGGASPWRLGNGETMTETHCDVGKGFFLGDIPLILMRLSLLVAGT